VQENLIESAYVLYRKLKSFLASILYYLCRLLPISRYKIVLSSFEGRQGYACNPKYIAEELARRNKERPECERYELVWLVNRMDKEFPPFIRKVKNTVWNRAFHLSTAAVWVDTHRKPLETRKRKGQFYINTWHGAIGFKPVGALRGSKLPKIAYLVSKHDSELIDVFLSNSEWCSELYYKAFFYEGQVLKTGSPRCDAINRRSQLRELIRRRYHLPLDANILLYAPTFRGGYQKTGVDAKQQDSSLDMEQLLQNLKEKFGGDWYIFVRFHPLLASKKHQYNHTAPKIIDVTAWDDAYELLAASDAFISDYSSLAFDALAMSVPVFIYAEDMREYSEERGELLWHKEELPFPVAMNNDELHRFIQRFDIVRYKLKIEQFADKVGLLEDGQASSRVADLIDAHTGGRL